MKTSEVHLSLLLYISPKQRLYLQNTSYAVYTCKYATTTFSDVYVTILLFSKV